jgi:hypothetical protein
MASELDRLIAPEILDDAFHAALRWLAEHEALRHVLEIGSSAGGGSTTALAAGLARNPGGPQLHCMELSVPRFAELRAAYAAYPFVHCYNMSSVPVARFPSEDEVAAFYRTHPTSLNRYELERVLGWLRQDKAYVASSGVPQDGIARIKAAQGIERFDMVLIDGSEFTGSAELDEVLGAGIVALDDTNAFKCHAARARLMADPDYVLIIDDQALRNGFSVFCRRDRPSAWREQGMRLERLRPGLSGLWRRVRRVAKRALGRGPS